MVNGISFRACTDSARDMLNQPQTHSRPQAAAEAPAMEAPKKKKGNKFLKALAGVVVAAAVVTAGLAAGKHFKGFDKIIEKVGADATGVKSWIKTGAEYANKGGEAIIGFGKTVCNAIKNILPKKETVEATAETVA